MDAYETRVHEGHSRNKFPNQTLSTSAATYRRTTPTVNNAEITAIWIQNNDVSISISLSEDGGSNYRTILPMASIAFFADTITNFLVKSASGTPACDIYFSTRP